jgi:hypothetical protein
VVWDWRKMNRGTWIVDLYIFFVLCHYKKSFRGSDEIFFSTLPRGMILDDLGVCHGEKWRGTLRLEVLVYNDSRRFSSVAQYQKVLILLTFHLFRYATPFCKNNLQKGGKNSTYVG